MLFSSSVYSLTTCSPSPALEGIIIYIHRRARFKISAPLFVPPFSFPYHPEIVAGNFTPTALAGAVVMIHGINFPFELDNRTIRWIVRAGFFVVGLATMVHPAGVIRYGALITGIVLLVAYALLGAFSPVHGIKTAISTAQGGADTRADGGRQ